MKTLKSCQSKEGNLHGKYIELRVKMPMFTKLLHLKWSKVVPANITDFFGAYFANFLCSLLSLPYITLRENTMIRF